MSNSNTTRLFTSQPQVLHLQSESCPGLLRSMCVLMSALSSSPHGESLGHLLITAPQTTSPRLSWSFSYFLLPGTPGWDRKASLPVHTPPPPSHRPIRDDEKQAMRWFAMLVMLDHPDSRQMSGQGNQHLNTQCTRPVPTPSDLRGSFGKAAEATD